MNKPTAVDLDLDETLALARHAVDRGDLENALLKLKSVLNQSVAAKSMVARLYAQLGLLEKAQHLFTEIVDDADYSELDTFQLGMTYFDQGRRDEAMHYWDLVLTRNPEFAPAMYYKALALSQMQQLQQAGFMLENMLKKVAADNYYFERAKQLQKTIQTIMPGQRAEYSQSTGVEH